MKGSSGFSVAMQKHLPEGKASSDVGPNITGNLWLVTGGIEVSGAYRLNPDKDAPHIHAGLSGSNSSIDIDASIVSSVYGSTATVQPSSLFAFACIKI